MVARPAHFVEWWVGVNCVSGLAVSARAVMDGAVAGAEVAPAVHAPAGREAAMPVRDMTRRVLEALVVAKALA